MTPPEIPGPSSIEEAFTAMHAQAAAHDKQRAEHANASTGCAVMVLFSIATFVAGVAIGHWCW